MSTVAFYHVSTFAYYSSTDTAFSDRAQDVKDRLARGNGDPIRVMHRKMYRQWGPRPYLHPLMFLSRTKMIWCRQEHR